MTCQITSGYCFMKKPFKISHQEKSYAIKRPLNSRLNLKKLKKIIKIKILNWKQDLRYNLLYKK